MPSVDPAAFGASPTVSPISTPVQGARGASAGSGQTQQEAARRVRGPAREAWSGDEEDPLRSAAAAAAAPSAEGALGAAGVAADGDAARSPGQLATRAPDPLDDIENQSDDGPNPIRQCFDFCAKEFLEFSSFWLGSIRLDHGDLFGDLPEKAMFAIEGKTDNRKKFHRVKRPAPKKKRGKKGTVGAAAAGTPQVVQESPLAARVGVSDQPMDAWMDMDLEDWVRSDKTGGQYHSDQWRPQTQTSAWTRPREDIEDMRSRQAALSLSDPLPDLPEDAPLEADDGISVIPQTVPIFTVLQVIVCFGLWAFFAIKNGTTEAGLDSIWKGMTDLKIHTGCESHRLQVWRWVTYQYTHGNTIHIILNSFYMIVLGTPMEGFLGHFWMFVFFTAGVIGGAFCFFVGGVHNVVIGMSGGIYSLWGLHFADAIMNLQDSKTSKKVLMFLFFILAIEVVMYFLQAKPTSNTAHVGGAVTGCLLGIVGGRNKVLRGCEREMQYCSYFLCFALTLFCLLWYMQWPPRSIFDPTPWCWAAQVLNTTTFDNEEYNCVRCDSQECIALFSPPNQLNVIDGIRTACSTWAHTGR